MTLDDVTTDVYRILKDLNKAIYPIASGKTVNPIMAKAVSSAVRRVLNSTNTAVSRIALSMVIGQQAYDLVTIASPPVSLGIRRVTRLRLVPEQGGEPVDLTQYYMQQIPYSTLTPRDPYAFALVSGQSVMADGLSLFVWPAPARSAVNAFIVDYDVNYTFTTSTTTSTPIYVTETLTDVVAWLAAADCLLESDDASDIEKSQFLRAQAERRLSDNYIVETASLRGDKNRAFP